MTDTATPPAPEAPAAQPETPQPTAAFSQADVDRIVKERLARAVPADYADIKAKAEEFEKFQEAQKTEAQKQADAAAATARERDAARAEALAYKVAATHGVTPDNFDLLGTGSEADITARAERIGLLLKSQSEVEQLKAEIEALRTGKPAPILNRPIADLKPGASPENALSDGDAAYAALYGS